MLDLIMPKKSGKEAGEAIRKIDPQMKILYTSGYTMDRIKNGELGTSDVDFIGKPALPKDLLAKVREILDR
jgi:DNA-binding response OmpR family regulator